MYNFADITGHDHIKSHLRKALESRSVSHAYLLCGPGGFGKALIAKAFAKALQCEKGGADACGVCPSCHAFDSGNHPDVFFIKPEKSKALSVEAIRENVVNNAVIRPYRSKYKIYIIENACQMTASAQNALLKTLEEPPPYGVFILCAENGDALLPTVLSRCVVMRFRPLPADTLCSFLHENVVGLSGDEAAFCAVFSSGGPGRALTLAQSGTDGKTPSVFELRKKVYGALEGITQKSAAETLLLYKVFEELKKNIDDVFMLAEIWYRDAAVLIKCGGERVLCRDMAAVTAAEAETLKDADIPAMLGAIETARLHLSQNVNFQMAVEAMLLTLRAGGKKDRDWRT